MASGAQFSTSSTLGASFTAASSTQLFALGTKLMGSDDSEWTYVYATAALTTGQVVNIFSGGTAIAFTTGILNGAAVTNTGPLALGVCQFAISSSQYGFVARRGNNMYIACTGTIAPSTYVGFAPSAGYVCTAGLVAVGQTAAGIFITTSASTATASVAVAALVYPRPLVGVPQA